MVREALATLADAEYQRRVWTGRGAEPGEMDSFEESVERLYTDSLLGDALDRRELVYSPEIDERLAALGRLLNQIDTQRSPKELVEDPAMDEVRRVAAHIRRELDSIRP
jgi:hypothetical protein